MSLLDGRVRQLQTSSPYPLHLLGVMEGGQEFEQQLHDRFATYRLQGEWFQPEADLLQFINTYAEQPSALNEGCAGDGQNASLDPQNERATHEWGRATAAGLGGKASFLLTTLAGQNRAIFTTEEAHEILGGSRSAVYKLIHDLVQRRWLHSLGKGRYAIIPLKAGLDRVPSIHEFLIAHHLAPEGYIAYWTALHHHHLTEQTPRSIWVATPRRRQETILIGVRYIFVTLRPHKIFAHHTAWIEGEAVPIADLEKSLVDSLDHPEHCGGIGEVAKALATAWEEHEVNLERLTEYALRMRNRAILKRLGYLVEHLSLQAGNFPKRWRAVLSAGYARLDPSLPSCGPHSRRWRVQVNVPESELTRWRES